MIIYLKVLARTCNRRTGIECIHKSNIFRNTLDHHAHWQDCSVQCATSDTSPVTHAGEAEFVLYWRPRHALQVNSGNEILARNEVATAGLSGDVLCARRVSCPSSRHERVTGVLQITDGSCDIPGLKRSRLGNIKGVGLRRSSEWKYTI